MVKMTDQINLIWLQGQGCTGCTISITGGSHPSIVDVLTGFMPQVEGINLAYHPTLMLSWGENSMKILEDARNGKYDPFVLILEGAIPDEDKAKASGGFYCGIGDSGDGIVTLTDILPDLAKRTAASVAIGTCASFGGIPHGKPNPTGAKSLMDFLGKEYKSTLGLPVINLPGCPPMGDNIIEAVAHLVLAVRGALPVPELDELNRPVFLYGETVHEICPRAGYFATGEYSDNFGEGHCMGMLGCKGIITHCNVPKRGFIEGIGGCTTVGGICIGCAEPEFPDEPFSPFLKKAPVISYGTEAIADIRGKVSALLSRLKPRRI